MKSIAYKNKLLRNKLWKQQRAAELLPLLVAQRTVIAAEKVKTLAPTEAAYLAGLIDSDGGIYATIKKDRRNGCSWPVASLYVTNTQRSMVEWVLAKTGAGSIYTNKNPTKNRFGTKPMHRWDVGNRSALFIARQIEPYLVVKHRQIILFIELAELKLASTKGNYSLSKDRQHEIAVQMQALNFSGSGRSGRRAGVTGC